MDELIVRWLQGNASSEEAELLRAWRARAPQNETRFRELEQVWKLTGQLGLPKRRRVPSAASITSGAERSNAVSPRRRLRPRTRARWIVAMAAAAAIALLAFGATFDLLRSPADSRGEAAIQFVTGGGEMASAYLADGTVVRLGPNSRLSATATATLREARLEGTAFFAVAHDEARPFVVTVDGGSVRVLGTRFRVSAQGETLDLTVLEGAVAVSAGAEDVVVRSGQAVQVRGRHAPPTIGVADLDESFRWLGGFIAFQSTPLRAAAAELEARFGESIRFGDPAVADITVTAWFTDATYDDVLAVLCRVAHVRCSNREGITWIDQ